VATATFWGNLGQDPELRYTQGGQPYLRLSVAENKGKPGEGRQEREEPTWWSVLLWGSMAQLYANVLRKGMRIAVQGRLEVSIYERKDGGTGIDRTIHADAIGFSTKRNRDEDGAAQEDAVGQSRRQPPAASTVRHAAPADSRFPGTEDPFGPTAGDIEDDPFADQ